MKWLYYLTRIFKNHLNGKPIGLNGYPFWCKYWRSACAW